MGGGGGGVPVNAVLFGLIFSDNELHPGQV